MRCSWTSPSPARSMPHRFRDAVQTVVARHPNLAARFSEQFGEPVQIILADPAIAWQYVEQRMDVDADEQIDQLCADERAAVCDLNDRPTFRAALIRTADNQHRCVLTIPPHRDRRLVAADPVAGDPRQLLRAPATRARALSQVHHVAGRARIATPRRPSGREIFDGFDTPTLVGPPDRMTLGRRGVRIVSGFSRDHAGAWRAGALVPHHRQHSSAGRLGAAAGDAHRSARRRVRHRGFWAAG